MSDYAYSGDLDMADMYFRNGDYGAARCSYQKCLRIKQKEPKNKQRIEYIEFKIEECNEMQGKK